MTFDHNGCRSACWLFEIDRNQNWRPTELHRCSISSQSSQYKRWAYAKCCAICVDGTLWAYIPPPRRAIRPHCLLKASWGSYRPHYLWCWFHALAGKHQSDLKRSIGGNTLEYGTTFVRHLRNKLNSSRTAFNGKYVLTRPLWMFMNTVQSIMFPESWFFSQICGI